MNLDRIVVYGKKIMKDILEMSGKFCIGIIKASINLFTCHVSSVILENFLVLGTYLNFQST